MTATLASSSVTSRALSVRLVVPWRGAWFAEVDLDPNDATNAPAGAVTLTLGTATAKGTTSTNEGGRFVAGVRAVVWAGASGWTNLVSAQDYANDAGVTTSDVLQAVAALVGETLVESSPGVEGRNFARFGHGPAARVFGDADWYVDLAGVTHVGTWPTVAPDSSLEIISYDAERLVLEVACDVPVLPGTQITDARFDGTLTVRSVEQTYTNENVRAKLWCSATGVDRFMSVFTNMVREVVGRHLLRCYRYRLVLEGSDGRVHLQCITPGLGAPDLLPIEVWGGMQGDSAQLELSSTLLVCFAEGDPTLPIVVGFEPGATPTSRTVDASALVKVGPSAAAVQLAGGIGGPLVLASSYASMVAAITALASALAALSSSGSAPVTGAVLGGIGSTFASALAALPPAPTTRVTAT